MLKIICYVPIDKLESKWLCLYRNNLFSFNVMKIPSYDSFGIGTLRNISQNEQPYVIIEEDFEKRNEGLINDKVVWINNLLNDNEFIWSLDMIDYGTKEPWPKNLIYRWSFSDPDIAMLFKLTWK